MVPLASRHLYRALIALLVACSPAPESNIQFESLASVQTLLTDTSVQVIDVRSDQEWEAGHLPQAMWLPRRHWNAAATRVPADGPVLLVCHSGGRAKRAANILINQGFVDVHVLIDAGVPDLLKI